MTDRKGCIERLLTCAAYLKNPRFSEIPFMCNAVNTMHEAADLLKEQEAVEPEVEVLNEIDRLYRCPRCHKHFFYEKQKYCDQCGQAVKWNDD